VWANGGPGAPPPERATRKISLRTYPHCKLQCAAASTHSANEGAAGQFTRGFVLADSRRWTPKPSWRTSTNLDPCKLGSVIRESISQATSSLRVHPDLILRAKNRCLLHPPRTPRSWKRVRTRKERKERRRTGPRRRSFSRAFRFAGARPLRSPPRWHSRELCASSPKPYDKTTGPPPSTWVNQDPPVQRRAEEPHLKLFHPLVPSRQPRSLAVNQNRLARLFL
jgi:hypothetical protein